MRDWSGFQRPTEPVRMPSAAQPASRAHAPLELGLGIADLAQPNRDLARWAPTCERCGMGAQRMDHVGIVVQELDRAVAFFEAVGLSLLGSGTVDEPWAGRVIGVPGTRAEIAMLETRDGGSRVELSTFLAAGEDRGPESAPANRLGIRHIAFVVDDVDAVLEQLRALGYDTVGTVEDYQDVYRLCYVRGPVGIIVELAQELSPKA